MIYHSTQPRMATEADIPRIKAILEDPDVSRSFGVLTVEGKTWDGAFEDLAWWIAPGIVMAAEIRADWSAWVHIAALPWARGRAVIEAAQFVIDALFERSKLRRLAGWTPSNLRAAQLFNRRLGFTPRRTVKKNDPTKARTLYVLTRSEWESARGAV